MRTYRRADEVGRTQTIVSRLVDCIETAYNRASEDGVDDLAGTELNQAWLNFFQLGYALRRHLVNLVKIDVIDWPAGVSLVLEGCNLPLLTVSWDDGSTRSLEITAA